MEAMVWKLFCRAGRAMALLAPASAFGADATISVHPEQVMAARAGPLRVGLCLEDVNHEVYGGLYSQMIFGESFQEPPAVAGPDHFKTFGGAWRVADGVLSIDGTDGPKCISDEPAMGRGTVSVQMRFDGREGDNAGLIVSVTHPGQGADVFIGYEISADPGRQVVRIGRHRNNFRLLTDAPAAIPVGEWFTLAVRIEGKEITASIDGREVAAAADGDGAVLPAGAVGVRVWNKSASFRKLAVDRGTGAKEVALAAPKGSSGGISGMWRPLSRGDAVAAYGLTTAEPFVGSQSQRVAFTGGSGEVGIENRGLNRWGLSVVAGRPYEGCVWARSEAATTLIAALESGDGATTYAEQALEVPPGEWRKLDLHLTPKASDGHARLTLMLRQPGAVTLGYAALQPGLWVRYQRLPVRRDVVDGLAATGATVIRYGGSMVNDGHYRWKQMLGPGDRRAPTPGTWYAHSSNGWGVIDFLNLAGAMGVEGIPDLNINESPQDLSNFVEYVNGPASSVWGRRRAEDGHPAPYDIHRLELGNEERLDVAYAARFNAIAAAVWARDKDMRLIAGDFSYHDPIRDPNHFSRADGGITNMDGHRAILAFAAAQGGKIGFDVHVWSEGLRPSDTLAALPSYLDAIDALAGASPPEVDVFELNANSHGVQRALANAVSINAIRRDGRIAIACSANALQPDGQNDNGWDQGLVFFNPVAVWLQPPGYALQLQSIGQPGKAVKAEVTGPAREQFDVVAIAGRDGAMTLQVVNVGGGASAEIDLGAFQPTLRTVDAVELGGDPGAANSASGPDGVWPQLGRWTFEPGVPRVHGFRGHSLTVLRFE